jgi:hypothetical protein
MPANELKPCTQLDRVPEVVTPWQIVQCPACAHYHHGGLCDNPKRHGPNDPCPFDGLPLPLREVSQADMDGAYALPGAG